jgi:branched-chain amino acid transport system permease protein
LFWLVLATCAIAALLVSLYLRTLAGALATPVRDNEIRVEYLGVSVNRLIHIKLVISGILAGIGGALAALVVEHVDPSMAYWTTSGGFVFVTILAGSGSVAGAFVASLVFELVRSIAVNLLPGTWQLILGSVLLLTILFVPEGLSSVWQRFRRQEKAL